jgi:hypothetical protein
MSIDKKSFEFNNFLMIATVFVVSGLMIWFTNLHERGIISKGVDTVLTFAVPVLLTLGIYIFSRKND